MRVSEPGAPTLEELEVLLSKANNYAVLVSFPDGELRVRILPSSDAINKMASQSLPRPFRARLAAELNENGFAVIRLEKAIHGSVLFVTERHPRTWWERYGWSDLAHIWEQMCVGMMSYFAQNHDALGDKG